MRVLVVDDHDGFRDALTSAFALVEGFEVAGQAADGEAAVQACVSLRPDVVLMDLSMPGISGIEATQRIRQRVPGQPVVMLTAHADTAIEQDARAAGVSAFLAKGSPFEQLCEALRVAAAGAAAGAAPGAGTAPERAIGA